MSEQKVRYTINKTGEFYGLFDENEKITVFVSMDKNAVIAARKTIVERGMGFFMNNLPSPATMNG